MPRIVYIIAGGVAVDAILIPDTATVTDNRIVIGDGEITPEAGQAYHEAETGAIGWLLDQDGWRPPPVVITPPTPEALTAYAADKRWRVETGGITVGGVVATDDRSKVMIMGARIKADADPSYTVGWKTAAGFVTIDAAQIVAISDAVLAHVEACFAAEASILGEIDAGTITAFAQIDAFAWPA